MIFELLFLVLFLASLIALVGAVIMMTGRRRGNRAPRLLRTLAVVWAVYLSIVFTVSATTPQRIVPLGQDICFDEMCFSVVRAEIFPQLGSGEHVVTTNGRFYVVTVRVSSHSRSRAQSEGGIHAELWDSGKYYGLSSEGQRAWETTNGPTRPLAARLQPGESVLSTQVFDVPRQSLSPSLILSHGFTPGYFVIGECPIFHKPTMQRLTP